MSNMSYCRFENTLLALEDCHSALEEGDIKDMSLDEERSMKRLISLCGEIYDLFHEDEVVDDDDRSYGNNRRR